MFASSSRRRLPALKTTAGFSEMLFRPPPAHPSAETPADDERHKAPPPHASLHVPTSPWEPDRSPSSIWVPKSTPLPHAGAFSLPSSFSETASFCSFSHGATAGFWTLLAGKIFCPRKHYPLLQDINKEEKFGKFGLVWHKAAV